MTAAITHHIAAVIGFSLQPAYADKAEYTGASSRDIGAEWVPSGTMYTADDGTQYPYHCPFFDRAAKRLSLGNEYYFMEHDPDAKLQWKGVTRYFDYYIPNDIPDGCQLPLLMVFHGGSTDNYSMYCNLMAELADFLQLADMWKFIVVFPNGTNPADGKSAPRSGEDDESNFHWDDCRTKRNNGSSGVDDNTPGTSVTPALERADDVGFMTGDGGLLDVMDAKLAARGLFLDRDRIYATGASNGGMMTLRLALEASQKVVAVAAFITLFFYDYPYYDESTGQTEIFNGSECIAPWEMEKPVPMLLINGTGDQWVNWDSGYVLGWVPRRGYNKKRCDPTKDKKPIYSGYGLAPQTYLDMLKNGSIGYLQYGSTITQLWPGFLSTGRETNIYLDWFFSQADPTIHTMFFTALESGHNVPDLRSELMRDTCLYGGHIESTFDTAEMAWLFLQQYRFDAEKDVVCDPLYDDPQQADSWCELVLESPSANASDLLRMLRAQKDAWANRSQNGPETTVCSEQ